MKVSRAKEIEKVGFGNTGDLIRNMEKALKAAPPVNFPVIFSYCYIFQNIVTCFCISHKEGKDGNNAPCSGYTN